MQTTLLLSTLTLGSVCHLKRGHLWVCCH